MKVQVTSVHFDADQNLLDFIQKRLDKLETFYDRVTEGEVIMRLNNKDGVDNKTLELKLLVPGTTLFCKEEAPTFESAADAAYECMRRQLVKHKEKQTAY